MEFSLPVSKRRAEGRLLMQKFRQEMTRALIQTTIMFFLAVLILKGMTGRYPWQMGDQLGIEVDSESSPSLAADETKATSHDYEF